MYNDKKDTLRILLNLTPQPNILTPKCSPQFILSKVEGGAGGLTPNFCYFCRS